MEHGTKMGCTDGGRPEHTTDEELSRVHDALQTLKEQPLALRAVWNALPYELRMDYNWSQWNYVASK